jgi:hypothetical protein
VDTPVRKAEKRPLNDLLSKIRWKGKIKRVQQPAQKVFVLMQVGSTPGRSSC